MPRARRVLRVVTAAQAQRLAAGWRRSSTHATPAQGAVSQEPPPTIVAAQEPPTIVAAQEDIGDDEADELLREAQESVRQGQLDLLKYVRHQKQKLADFTQNSSGCLQPPQTPGREALRMVELDSLHCGLYPDGRKTLDMVLLANPLAGEEQSLCVSDFATDAFDAAAQLQRTAVKWRMDAGASADDARTSVAQSKGIDLGLLFGVPPEDTKAIAELCFGKEDRKRKAPDA